MIASDVGGIPEILPAKNLCPPGNPEALARHIEMALAIPASPCADSTQRTSFNADNGAELAILQHCRAPPFIKVPLTMTDHRFISGLRSRLEHGECVLTSAV